MPEIDLFGSMTNQEYVRWNVSGCVRRLEEAPLEYSITLMVYEIHKNILRRQDVSEEDLEIGDRQVEDAKRRYIQMH